TETIGGTQSWKQTFTFDRYGNRRFDTANTTTLAPGCAEAICNPQIDPATNKLIGYQFDNAGNTKVDANGQTFVYDSENKQVQVNDSAGTIGQYFYDGDGKRVKKIVPLTGETTIFVHDATGKLVAEYSTIVAPTNEAKIAYLTNDHLGSPRITTDQFGQTISRRDFMPFGEEIIRTNYGSDSVRQKFTGYERDIESELDFAQARYYTQRLGRFTSVDPITVTPARVVDPQQINLYAYVRNNPLEFIDPTGMIIDTTRLTKKQLKTWNRTIELAIAKDDKGNYLNSELQKEYARLQDDKRTFFIENFAFGDKSGTAGRFTITKFNGENDFSEAKIQLDFKKIADIQKPTAANLVEGFNKFEGLFGKNGKMLRFTELFGHEAAHAVYALDNTTDMVNLQKGMNERDATLEALPKKNRYPLPPDLAQKMEAVDTALIPTERYAQQKEQIINGELRASQKSLRRRN
ncbi:MAG: RHS repeat-associated core domain-containing protein, partial [Pyrinomonadaceae bacterium]